MYFIPLIIVPIIISLMIVVSLGVVILIIGIPIACRVAVAIIIMALLIARHDVAVAIENLMRVLHQFKRC